MAGPTGIVWKCFRSYTSTPHRRPRRDIMPDGHSPARCSSATIGAMRIVTYNVNGINARLPNLLRWLNETRPDVVCLQELKAPQEKFPEASIREAGYGVIWHGQKSWNGVAILTRGTEPVEIRRALPGDPDDVHSRYIEATVHDLVIGCL